MTTETRYEYSRDAQGNWIERIVWSRADPSADFTRVCVDRRLIEYY
jgi:hypothetical protein